ncbi:MAG: class D sortase [Pseudomonadota bacterium]
MIEVALGTLGATCLIIFGLSQWQSAQAQTKAKAQLEAAWTIKSPDQNLWSNKRVAVYEQQIADAPVSEAIGLVSIERLGINVAVFDGTSEKVLNIGAGRIPGTARFGRDGNLAIAAHRDGFFRGLKDIRVGDAISVKHGDGNDQFVVTNTWIVEPDDVSVLEPTDERSITLVTCYPFYFVGNAPQRFIVRGVASDDKSIIKKGERSEL